MYLFYVYLINDFVFLGESMKYNFDTIALHGGYEPDKTTNSVIPPIYQTASYVFNDSKHAADLFALKEFGNIYTRLMNPTNDVVEKRVALLEGGVGGLLTASGMAAISLAVLTIAGAGDEIVASVDLYGGTYTLFEYTLKNLGIKTTFVDPSDPDNFKKAITNKTKLIYSETLGNPKLNVLDIEKVAAIAHKNGLPFIIDNTVATPYLVRPIEYGADIVVHSMTKYIGGHGTSIGGIIIDSGKFNWNNGKFPVIAEPNPSYHNMNFWETFGNVPDIGNIAYIIRARVNLLRDIGSSASPFNAFLFLIGLETLSLRMERHSSNALKVAQFLENHPKTNWVNYPGLSSHPSANLVQKYLPKGASGLMGFGVKGGSEAGKKFIENLKLISHLANIGDARSLAIHPASTTHQQLSEEEQIASGVTPDFIRLSIGLEDVNDIIADIDQALKKV